MRYVTSMSSRKAKKAIKEFKDYCKKHRQRVTPPREYILEIIASSDRPMSAYDALDALSHKLDNPKPPTAYRALDFLMKHGFVHRIESLNAYITCTENHKHHGSQFMICERCNKVEEIHLCSLPNRLKDKVEKDNFTMSHWNAEIHGICSKCR